jgi:hypothetical protein
MEAHVNGLLSFEEASSIVAMIWREVSANPNYVIVPLCAVALIGAAFARNGTTFLVALLFVAAALVPSFIAYDPDAARSAFIYASTAAACLVAVEGYRARRRNDAITALTREVAEIRGRLSEYLDALHVRADTVEQRAMQTLNWIEAERARRATERPAAQR